MNKSYTDFRGLDVGGQVFKSLAQVTSWMALNSPTLGSHVAFVDASGLLAISHREQLSPMEHAKLKSLTGKVGVGLTVAEVKLDFSFSWNSCAVHKHPSATLDQGLLHLERSGRYRWGKDHVD